MTNEQLTQEVLKLAENQAKQETKLEEVIEDVKTTKSLAEDVHIMAINMENMKITLNDTNAKVNSLNLKDYNNYQENKKNIKNNIISVISGAIGTAILGFLIWFLKKFVK